MAHKSRQKDGSFCEKSMEVMVNIIKLSSFSLATLSLGEEQNTTRRAVIPSPINTSSNSQMSKSERSQATVSKSKMQTYLMEQDAGDPTLSSSNIIDHRNKENHVNNDDDYDDSFDDYIDRFHRRNNQDDEVNNGSTNGKSSSSSSSSSYIRRFSRKDFSGDGKARGMV